jgi:hypothetical protein
MKAQWRRLVKERNQLVHSTLLAFDLNSPEGCSALSAHLDEQYERAQLLFHRLVRHQRNRALAASVLMQLLESGQLSNLVDNPNGDA